MNKIQKNKYFIAKYVLCSISNVYLFVIPPFPNNVCRLFFNFSIELTKFRRGRGGEENIQFKPLKYFILI